MQCKKFLVATLKKEIGDINFNDALYLIQYIHNIIISMWKST